MALIALTYHDIIERAALDASGFPGPDAAHYKLSPEELRTHLSTSARSSDLVFTFDDGGVSAIETTAGLLEDAGLRGLFFVVTSVVGNRAFLSVSQLRELVSRGHGVGTHTVTHPIPISRRPREVIFAEWRDSRAQLEQWLGAAVFDGSVPGGFTSAEVEQEAAHAGLRRLFTSDPTLAARSRDGMTVVGRYSVTRASSLRTMRDVLAGSPLPWYQQRALWSAKKLVKAVGGTAWLEFRRRYFAARRRI